MIITNEQKEMLKEYGIDVFDNVDDVLLALDGKITEIGFNSDYSLNEEGAKLQKLYDELYMKN